MKALIIEDDRIEAMRIRNGLSDAGFLCDVTHTGKDGYRLMATGSYDIAVVDICLEDGVSGIDVVREAKAGGDKTPTIFLSAISDPDTKARGLNNGADYYLSKPYTMNELVARVQAIRRRTNAGIENEGRLVCDDITVNLVEHAAYRGTRRLDLKPCELHLLEILVRNRGRTFEFDTLLSRVCDYNISYDRNIVQQMVSKIRKQLNADGEPDPITTVHNIGYVIR